MNDDEIYKAADGTWTVDFTDMDAGKITGIPTFALADAIAKAMWKMHRSGANDALAD